MGRSVIWIVAGGIAVAVSLFSVYWNGQNGFGVVGNIASVLGLLVTLDVAFAVHSLKSQYASRAMLGSGLSRLRDSQRALLNAIQSGDAEEIRRCLGEISAIITEVNLHLPEENRVKFIQEEITIAVSDDRRKLRGRAQSVFGLLQSCITSIELHVERTNWRRTDV